MPGVSGTVLRVNLPSPLVSTCSRVGRGTTIGHGGGGGGGGRGRGRGRGRGGRGNVHVGVE